MACAGDTAQPLRDGSVLEVWHEGSLRFGNYRGRAPSSSALRVELASGELVKLDSGQLVDLWEPSEPGTGGGALPNGTAEWAALQLDAAALLADLPPHMLDLRPLWQSLLQQKGAKRVTSRQVAASLFADAKRAAAAAPAPLAARLAAAQLLAEERTLFKRQQGQLSWPEEAGSPPVLGSARGFKVLPRAQANSRAEVSLLATLERKLAGEEVTWAPSTLPLLAELEALAIGLGECSKPLSRMLQQLGRPATADVSCVPTAPWGRGCNAANDEARAVPCAPRRPPPPPRVIAARDRRATAVRDRRA